MNGINLVPVLSKTVTICWLFYPLIGGLEVLDNHNLLVLGILGIVFDLVCLCYTQQDDVFDSCRIVVLRTVKTILWKRLHQISTESSKDSFLLYEIYDHVQHLRIFAVFLQWCNQLSGYCRLRLFGQEWYVWSQNVSTMLTRQLSCLERLISSLISSSVKQHQWFVFHLVFTSKFFFLIW